MGGNAIKSSSRITPMEYDLTLNHVIENVLNVHNCDYRIIPFYSEKTSFGDLMGLLKQHNKSSDKRLQVVKEGKYNFSRLDDFIVSIV